MEQKWKKNKLTDSNNHHHHRTPNRKNKTTPQQIEQGKPPKPGDEDDRIGHPREKRRAKRLA